MSQSSAAGLRVRPDRLVLVACVAAATGALVVLLTRRGEDGTHGH